MRKLSSTLSVTTGDFILWSFCSSVLSSLRFRPQKFANVNILEQMVTSSLLQQIYFIFQVSMVVKFFWIIEIVIKSNKAGSKLLFNDRDIDYEIYMLQLFALTISLCRSTVLSSPSLSFLCLLNNIKPFSRQTKSA